jgi:hypothetical protein
MPAASTAPQADVPAQADALDALRQTVAGDLLEAIARRDRQQTLGAVAVAVRIGADLRTIRQRLNPAGAAFLSFCLTEAVRRGPGF